MCVTLKIAQVFSETPGGRYRKDGPHSGEEFREEHLRPRFENLKVGQTILIDLDGGYGYPTSFLEEAFGGLARIYGSDAVLGKLVFKSEEEPNLKEEVVEYIRNASTTA